MRFVHGALGLLLAVTTSACTHADLSRLLGQPKEADTLKEESVTRVNEPSEVQPEGLDYSFERIQELELIAEQSPSARARADAHYFLGWIYAYAENPLRDYYRSLHEFETYLSLVEPDQRRTDAESWAKALTELTQTATLKTGGAPEVSEARIAELEALAGDATNPRVRADAHYFLGLIFVQAETSRRDYVRALKEFEAYLELADPEQVPVSVTNWVAVLKELRKTGGELEKQKATVSQHEKRIAEMEQDIQKLKELDVWLEDQKKQEHR